MFRFNGYTYDVFVRPWKKKNKFEFIKWKTGLRNFWERISKAEYDETLKNKNMRKKG